MTSAPLVLLGMEIGDPDCIQAWAQQGCLPTIASLMKRGWWGRTAGPELICEHGTALSLFSGVSRARHGYFNFRGLKPGTYEMEPRSPADTGLDPFWAHWRGRNRKVAILDAPETACVPGIPGFQLADTAALGHERHPSSHPPELLAEARREIGQPITRDYSESSTLPQDLDLQRRLLEQTSRKGAWCRKLLARDVFDLVIVVFSETHVGSHWFWKYTGGTSGNPLTHAIRDLYQAIDREMGLLLEQLPVEANVFVFSLFGMQTNYPTSGFNDILCRRLGYQTAPPPGPPSFRPVDLARRVLPESWRFAISKRLPRATQERLLADQLRLGTDWRRTTAFTIPSLFTTFVRVNLRGREPQGIVEPGAGYDQALSALEGDLKQLTHPDTGEPAVDRITRTCEAFGGGPPESLPDLFVEWKPTDQFVTRVVHPRAVLKQRRPAFCPGSEERLCGFVGGAGPSIPQGGDIGEIPVLDLAPTFLSLLGEPIPAGMSGRPVETIRATTPI